MIKTREQWRDVKPLAVFGDLIVLGHQFRYHYGPRNWRYIVVCRCSCGSTCTAAVLRLHSGRCSACPSCGDKKKLSGRVTAITKHGEAGTPLWNCWQHMKARCNYSKDSHYKYYGGRGIRVCSQWTDFVPFRDWAKQNGYREDLQIDRKDVNGNYEPDNCRFVDIETQANNKRNNRVFTIDGEAKTISQWSRDSRCVVNLKTLGSRLYRGWSFTLAMTTLPNSKGA